jgi:menaquinone-dependent protoporphyrinogen IX oxidase
MLMTTLVAYYSRTGSNRTVAEAIAGKLGAEIDEIVDLRKRGGVIGWLRSGRAAMKGSDTEVKSSKDPAQYDTIVIGGPIWGGHLTPAVRTYVRDHDLTGKRLAFFFVSGKGEVQRAVDDLRETLPGADFEVLSLGETEVKSDQHGAKLEGFVDELTGH